jgi:trans-aconitate methyltransferase
MAISNQHNNPDHPTWNPTIFEKNAGFVAELGAPLITLLAPQAHEHILDLGCGDGALTAQIMEYGCQVQGIDARAEMVQIAQKRGISASVKDAHELNYHHQFDAVFSNAVLHSLKHPEKVIDSVWRALKPGGRFVAEFGGTGNIATIVNAIEKALSMRDQAVNNPWYFPSMEEYRKLLLTRGFQIKHIELFKRPTSLPGDMRAWIATFTHPFTANLAPYDKVNFINEVTAMLRPTLCDEHGNWTADYVRLKVYAYKSTAMV